VSATAMATVMGSASVSVMATVRAMAMVLE
jgi:hypothetical protein